MTDGYQGLLLFTVQLQPGVVMDSGCSFNRVNVNVHLMYYKLISSEHTCVHCRRGLLIDKRSEPRTSERVPYVIVYGTPGQPLIQLVRKPDELLENPGLRLNGVYYITKQILPALDRAFSLLGVDVRQW